MNPKRMMLLGTLGGCLVLSGLLVRADEVSTAQLIGDLKSADESVQLQAIDQLGSQGEAAAEAVRPLVRLLKDDSALVRAHAVRALGEIGSPAKPVVPAITALLKDSDQTVRRQVVRALRSIRPGPRVTLPIFLNLLQDSDPGVRMHILSSIAEAGPEAVPFLVAGLKNDDACYWACLVLREIGPKAKGAVPALIDRLQDPRPEIRREAALALAAMDEAAAPAAEQLVAALKDENTRVAATYALGRIGQIPADAEAVIQANAKSDDKILSTTSLWVLARVHPEDKQLRREATEQLIERLRDQNPLVRLAAARALAALPPAPEITAPIWENAFQDADETTVLHALDALAALGPSAVPHLIDALEHDMVPGHVAYVLGRIGPDAAPATEALAALIDNEDQHVANEAILALASIGPGAKDAVVPLTEALQQSENPNFHAIVYALGKIGPDAAEAEPVLTDLLDGPDNRLALISAWALAHIGPDSAEVAAKTVPVLVAGLSDNLPMARQGAAEALGSLGASAKDAIPALQKAAKDGNEAVRKAAQEAVKSIRDRTAVE